MELTVVGSGTAVPEPDRVGSGYFVRIGTSRVLLDCGPGVVHHMARHQLPWNELTHLCISHFHTDHIGDVPALIFALKYGQAEPRKDPLMVFGPPGTRRLFRRFATTFGDYMKDPGFVLMITEIKPGKRLPLNDVAHLSATPTPHTAASFAYRIDGPQSSLGYTGDTGPDVDVGAFLQAVDLLITECSMPDELAMEGHLTPSLVATLARVALPKKLLVTHIYPQLPRSSVLNLIKAAGWEGEMVLAEDGMRINLARETTG